MQIPNPKHQIPDKYQTLRSNCHKTFWSLGFGIWNFILTHFSKCYRPTKE